MIEHNINFPYNVIVFEYYRKIRTACKLFENKYEFFVGHAGGLGRLGLIDLVILIVEGSYKNCIIN